MTQWYSLNSYKISLPNEAFKMFTRKCIDNYLRAMLQLQSVYDWCVWTISAMYTQFSLFHSDNTAISNHFRLDWECMFSAFADLMSLICICIISKIQLCFTFHIKASHFSHYVVLARLPPTTGHSIGDNTRFMLENTSWRDIWYRKVL